VNDLSGRATFDFFGAMINILAHVSYKLIYFIINIHINI
jgi:hypothetical protein